MIDMTGQVKTKIEEYDIKIFDHHKVEAKKQEGDYVFFCEQMVVFIYRDDSISVAFQATTKPDEAANLALIINEIPDVDLNIMESFIYCDNEKLICGDDAYDLVRKTIKDEGAKECMREATYTHLLNSNYCHEC